MSKETYVAFAKADNTNPSTNPKLKEICDQLRDIREDLKAEMNNAALEDRDKEFKEYSELDIRAKAVMDGIGCEATAPPAVDRFIDDAVFTDSHSD